MKSVQYFNFQNSLAALNFYEKHLGATDIQRIGGDHDMFADMPEEYDIDKNFTMNASFKILGETFYCSDTMKNKKIDNSGAIVAFTFDYSNEADKQQAEAFFNKAVEGGCKATMPLGKTEWSELYGMFNDPFGVTWMINAE
ncbi:glyoxalase/bleomycin resistance/extradiol dioxygenase family protein [Staphylococcus equorum]|uniref:Glyoxalase/bleomycin resistance/extradiol dioxygenase family protein n=1 Tax=Staphylococcus equorum TaxID=246432 RepID=A0A9X4LIL4_9STAP|nr:glyoxalase/bleomycin resistance/extradiol dioxygenase family protein [Staphylococcus equorum]MDG0844531.1 glyoxalase/bleomycin resistance/extradiol dioxygenase family protein [Staphylococcus equorum]MDG0860738.1 glyoxalase/bleomycin resistance/extradiol dioxygenase family protein [Staphylococcus equorum]